MSVIISSVDAGSLAAKKGLHAGDTLISINGHEISDVLDYQFYLQDKKLHIAYLDGRGKAKKITVKKDQFDDIGLSFETYLMDKQHACSNNCIFCFVHQMPKGMRKTLYFKDDDTRLSFLFGNYVTLTNLSEREVQRIIDMHISPVNVSVHTMNPSLRVEMMKNPNAGECLKLLSRFAAAGIELNTQLVLCPGINDGPELEFSLSELEKLLPSLRSIAAVPVGLTKYRDHLPHLEPYQLESARQVIRIMDDFGEKCLQHYGRRVAYCADEFYLNAGLPLPEPSYYEDYPQLENGVGLWTSLDQEFRQALSACELPGDAPISVSLATGVAAFPLLDSFRSLVLERFPAAKIDVYAIENDFFGHSVTVAGLITAKDLIAQLKGKDLHGRLLLPSVMLKSDEDIFLDDLSLKDVAAALNVEVQTAENDGFSLLEHILNTSEGGF